ncbi:hypothetical protein P152DRAFT_457633 [Eremomyces bilateralis CBS 781.70]|uniref:Uncharacterized protein n=1 Tax=Eremomyces bilateralis CBS 781.70 TaxID=1392243 RepID=A0A6G1G5Q1_9PEZI|nr:uncharacterized protein P152DRAFT_457633 [Eremomyces bilateralis CBS 781.70]KAF1813266.1 hypothetical protein P152DRAFT_457633 [Eremomyces bilateralis CBS 781.70]
MDSHSLTSFPARPLLVLAVLLPFLLIYAPLLEDLASPRPYAKNPFVTTQSPSGANETRLQLTALVSTAQDTSAIECWELNTPFTVSEDAGISGAMALPFEAVREGGTYTVLPARFYGGLHTAPREQLVHFTAGLAHVTLPDVQRNSKTEAWVKGGRDGLIVATDTTGRGHVTEYPLRQQTVAIQLPLVGGVEALGGYRKVGDGPCL